MNTTTTPKIAHWSPKKQKITQKQGKNQKLELKKTYKIKVVHLHE